MNLFWALLKMLLVLCVVSTTILVILYHNILSLGAILQYATMMLMVVVYLASKFGRRGV
jgi:hypothetical protein